MEAVPQIGQDHIRNGLNPVLSCRFPVSDVGFDGQLLDERCYQEVYAKRYARTGVMVGHKIPNTNGCFQ